MLSINQSIMGKKEIVSNSETSKIPSELSEFTSVKIIYLTEIIINKVVKMSGSETFCRFTFANRKTIKIPFRIAHKSDAQEILGFMKNTHAYNLSPFKSFIQNLAQQEKIDLPKSVDERMAEIGLQVTELAKERLPGHRILIYRKISHYIDWFQDSSKSSVRIQLWTGSTSDTPPEFLENNTSEFIPSSINSKFESNAWPSFTKLQADALAKNIAKIKLEEFFLMCPDGRGYRSSGFHISFPVIERFIEKIGSTEPFQILEYIEGNELLPIKFFLERVFRSKSKINSCSKKYDKFSGNTNFPEDIDSRLSEFGLQVTESLKSYFKSHEFFKDKTNLYKVTWIPDFYNENKIRIKIYESAPEIS